MCRLPRNHSDIEDWGDPLAGVHPRTTSTSVDLGTGKPRAEELRGPRISRWTLFQRLSESYLHESSTLSGISSSLSWYTRVVLREGRLLGRKIAELQWLPTVVEILLVAKLLHYYTWPFDFLLFPSSHFSLAVLRERDTNASGFESERESPIQYSRFRLLPSHLGTL